MLNVIFAGKKALGLILQATEARKLELETYDKITQLINENLK